MDLIDYLQRHKETLDLLSKPEWIEVIIRSRLSW